MFQLCFLRVSFFNSFFFGFLSSDCFRRVGRRRILVVEHHFLLTHHRTAFFSSDFFFPDQRLVPAKTRPRNKTLKSKIKKVLVKDMYISITIWTINLVGFRYSQIYHVSTHVFLQFSEIYLHIDVEYTSILHFASLVIPSTILTR